MAKFYRYQHKFWIRLFPELSLFDDVDEREEAYRGAMKSMTWRGLLFTPFFVIISIFVFGPIVGFVRGYFTFVADLYIFFDLQSAVICVQHSTRMAFRFACPAAIAFADW